MEKQCQNGLNDEGIFYALKECFKRLDEDFQGTAGATATVALILDGKVWVANVGDSRTILVKNDGTSRQASEDAKPDIPRYKRKIEKLGGFVSDGLPRVNSRIAVARAIGDKDVIGSTGVCVMSPSPKITCFPLDFDYAILACDGLYDVATTNEVGAAVVGTKNESAEMQAKRLVHAAIELCGSSDNVSVMVIKR